jgi:hypothetical protein
MQDPRGVDTELPRGVQSAARQRRATNGSKASNRQNPALTKRDFI